MRLASGLFCVPVLPRAQKAKSGGRQSRRAESVKPQEDLYSLQGHMWGPLEVTH